MSDDASTVRPADQAQPGYETKHISYNGHEYTFRFYKGFVSRLHFTPPGAKPIEVYNQGSDVFHCPDTGPDPDSKVYIGCATLDMDIELDVDDSPITPPTYRGTIEQIDVFLKKPGTEDTVKPHKKVKIARGGKSVERIIVVESGVTTGGVRAMQEGDEGTVTVENHAKTCPPDCDPNGPDC